ncbi:hypothetical protein [Haloferax sp. Q22]|uniref:hypothetical protein n=1 Tax=Haloferax sp. (strain Q22) TaxID=1526048 RepID=UPI000737D108|nr:hypothetical protein [Haloferax sp. Q22]
MSAGNDQLRREVNGKFRPPLDVLIDPSLLVASSSLERLTDSKVFESQTQATLGEMPTKPRIRSLCVPATFRELLENGEQHDVQNTSVWNFYRGQAETSSRDQVVASLDRNGVSEFSIDSQPSGLQWENALDKSVRDSRLLETLGEEHEFLRSGGVVLSRTPTFVKALRDAGSPTVDVGKAQLTTEVRDRLTDIGYKDPASVCVFGVSSAGSTVDALVGDILSTKSDLLLYRLDA